MFGFERKWGGLLVFFFLAAEKASPLQGGASRYPGFLISGQPPARLTLMYPPHLEILNRGFAMGADWIIKHPGAFLSLLLRKAPYFAEGATLGM